MAKKPKEIIPSTTAKFAKRLAKAWMSDADKFVDYLEDAFEREDGALILTSAMEYIDDDIRVAFNRDVMESSGRFQTILDDGDSEVLCDLQLFAIPVFGPLNEINEFIKSNALNDLCCKQIRLSGLADKEADILIADVAIHPLVVTNIGPFALREIASELHNNITVAGHDFEMLHAILSLYAPETVDGELGDAQNQDEAVARLLIGARLCRVEYIDNDYLGAPSGEMSGSNENEDEIVSKFYAEKSDASERFMAEATRIIKEQKLSIIMGEPETWCDGMTELGILYIRATAMLLALFEEVPKFEPNEVHCFFDEDNEQMGFSYVFGDEKIGPIFMPVEITMYDLDYILESLRFGLELKLFDKIDVQDSRTLH